MPGHRSVAFVVVVFPGVMVMFPGTPSNAVKATVVEVTVEDAVPYPMVTEISTLPTRLGSRVITVEVEVPPFGLKDTPLFMELQSTRVGVMPETLAARL